MNLDEIIKVIEKELALLHHKKYCVLVSRGAVAIYLALKSLTCTDGKIIVPANMCMSPVNMIIYAGFQPVFCDVSLSDYNIDINDLEKKLKTNKNVRAVLLPHIYGYSTDMELVRALLKKYKLKLIEDCAQSLGGYYKDKPLGSFGDFTIQSFGHTKILDAGGGGAILFDNKKYLEEIRKQYRLLPHKSEKYDELQSDYSILYYQLIPWARKNRLYGKLFSSFPYIFKDLYIYQGIEDSVVKTIAKKLTSLKSDVRKRNENVRYYKKYLVHDNIIHPQNKWDGACWRYSILLKDLDQQKISENVRKFNIDISNWYPPLHLFYERFPENLINAEYVGSHIVNLWVNPEYSENDIMRVSEKIINEIEKYINK